MLLEGHLIRFCESWRQAHFGSVSKHREKIPRPHRTKRLILCFQQSWRIHKITIHSRENSEKISQKFRENRLKNFGPEEFKNSPSTIGQKFVKTLVVVTNTFCRNFICYSKTYTNVKVHWLACCKLCKFYSNIIQLFNRILRFLFNKKFPLCHIKVL